MSAKDNPILTAALEYAALGWYLLPVDGKKPAFNNWQATSSNDPKQIRAWFKDGRYGIGLDLGRSGLLVLDADRPGRLAAAGLDADTLDGWQYRGNPDRVSWLYRQGDVEIRQGKVTWGDIKARGGLVVLPGSPHYGTPEDCAMCEMVGVGSHPYEWISRIGDRPPVLPDDVAARLPQRQDAPVVSAWTGALTDEQRKQADDWLLDRRMEIIGRLARTAIDLPNENDVDDFGKGWEARATEAAYNLARLAVTGWLDYDVEDAKEDFEKALPEDLRLTEECPGKFRDAVVHGLLERASRSMHQPPWVDVVFDASPILAHIRQAAHSRMLPSRGLLLMTLARIAVEVPETTVLPPVVGGPASLNFGVAAVGASAQGKSATFEVSRELLGLVGEDQKTVERVPGSGEGLVDTFLDAPVTDPATGKKSRPLIADPRRLFYVDEIGQLGAIKDGRSGSTIGPTLRSSLTGGPLGQENATIERRRYVPAGRYRAVLIVGVQPTAADVLLNDYDIGVGTPQRLSWVLMIDPTIPDEAVEWPGDLGWSSPTWPSEVLYPAHVQDEVRRAARARARGEVSAADALNGHALLTRLKVAALLAFLHDEVEISDQWWTLAGVIVDEWGGEALLACRRELSRVKEKQAEASGRMRAQSRLAEDVVVGQHTAKQEGVTASLTKAVKAAGEDGLAWSELRKTIRSDRREIADGLVGTPDAPGPLVTSGRLRLETVEYQGQTGLRVFG